MKKLLFLLLFLPFIGFSQGGTWPVRYSDSDPSGAPSAAGTRLYFNTATNTLFFWEPAPSSTWRKQPKAFDQITGCAAPAYTPTARQSTFAVNSCAVPELYQWTGAAWVQLNEGAVYTAGTGIAISGGNVISNTGDLSATNELNTSLSVSGSNLQIVDAGGTLTVPVSDIAPVQAVATGSGINISGTTTRTISAVDASATNELQTLSIAGQDLTLSGGGGTVALPDGADGNGIYDGSGIIPNGTNAKIAAAGAFQLQYSNGQSGLVLNDNAGGAITVSSPGSDSYIEISPSALTLGTTIGGFVFDIDNETIILTGPQIGWQYDGEYPDILTNDRSIPDVGLTKQLIASENGALGTGFTSGGGTGTIPAGTIAENGANALVFTTANSRNLSDAIGTKRDVDNYSITGIYDDVDGQFAQLFSGKEGDQKTEYLVDYNGLSVSCSGDDFATSEVTFSVGPFGATITNTFDGLGVQYAADYSATIVANPTSITDVTSVNLLKQTPVSYTNAAAPNNCIFYSTTLSKLAYKDPGGTVNPLY